MRGNMAETRDLRGQIRDKVDLRAWGQVCNRTRGRFSFRGQVYSQIAGRIRDHIASRLQVQSQVEGQVRNQVSSQIRK